MFDHYGDNPWRAINLWLAQEAILRVVADRQLTEPFLWSHELFKNILSADPNTPPEFHARGSATLDAFDAWWKTCAAVLTNAIRAGPGALLNADNGQTVTQWLAHALQACHLGKLVELTGHKNNRLTNAIGQVNAQIPGPNVPPGWLEGLASRLLAAYHRHDPGHLSTDDVARLKVLLNWVRENHFDDLIGPNGLAGATVTGIVLGSARGGCGCLLAIAAVMGISFGGGPVVLKGAILAQVLREWEDLCNLVRMRNLPPVVKRVRPGRMANITREWGRSRPVQDLFSYPIDGHFRGWVALARAWWLPV